MKQNAIGIIACFLCTACAVSSPLPTGQSAYRAIDATEVAPIDEDYVIGPLDTVAVNVFQEPDLSVEDAQIEPSGRLPLPLLGSVDAAGKTADALEAEIRQKLAKYLVDPRVTVSVASITQKVIVEGSVNQPGVYDIRGNSSLIEALAMAESPNEVADLDEVFVFRRINGQTQGARFDLRKIRAGVDADPAIIAGDRIVVGINELGAVWRNYLGVPIFNVFRVF